jgi:alkanesulfonate monooxygenase SsuD/methylene tetrahydromethanopterin reductase-like flavin-dependent oxidoreductase (luciferase family)
MSVDTPAPARHDTTVSHRGAVGAGLTFGLSGLAAQTEGRAPGDYHHELRRVIELAALAEEVGLDAVWTCEHHFSEDGFLPSPIVMLAAIAERTERITIGTDIMLAPMWDPVRLAEDAAVVDQISSGRVVLGFGAGYRDDEFEGLGFRRRDRVPRMVECMRVLRDSWSGDPVEGLGITEPGTKLLVTPPPFQTGGPPVWMGGFVEAAVRRARRLGDGYIAPQIGPGGLRKRIGWLQEEGPLDGFSIAMSIIGFVAAKDAWRTVRHGMGLTEAQYRRWQNVAGDLPELQGKEWDHGATDDTPPPAVVVGTPEECVEMLRPFADILANLPGDAVGHLTARLTYPGTSDAENTESVRLFATEVVPALRELATVPSR